ncbi:MAG: GNAT family N-acetyltransferase [Solirubrobacteraceae bacterium]
MTAIAVTDVGPATIADWADAHARSSGTTFFHGPVWAQLWQAYSGGFFEPAPQRVEFEDGRSAILGVIRAPTRLPGVRRHYLSCEGNCGGWVTGDELEAAHARALAQQIVGLGSVVWRRHPLDVLATEVSVAATTIETTHLIDLRNGADAARARWRKTARHAAAGAERNGAVVRQATSLDDWSAYFDLYERMSKRWARPMALYNRALFSLLGALDDDDVELWLTELDGRLVGGGIFFRHGGHVVNWHGISDTTTCPGASNLLDWKMIDVLAARGIATYDLNGSGPNPGVVWHKESMGGVATPIPTVFRTHPLERIGRSVKRRLIRQPPREGSRA